MKLNEEGMRADQLSVKEIKAEMETDQEMLTERLEAKLNVQGKGNVRRWKPLPEDW
jgi:hypothetical protein